MMTSRLLKFFAWSSLAAIIFVTVSPIGLRPHDPLPVDIDRALAFAVMAFLFVSAYPKKAWMLLVVLALGAGAIEALQLISPTRHAHLFDACIKAGGAVAGSLAAMAIGWLRAKWADSPARLARRSAG